jgi:predicted metal-dependent enzyme (double-stranded beta helix superfamily)
MNESSTAPKALGDFCKQCADGLSGLISNQERIRFVSSLMPEYLRNKDLFRKILHGICEGDDYLDLRYGTMFDNEIILYRDPGRLFSLRFFIWEAGCHDPIHDHNAWGVVGCISGHLEIVNYRRIDDGSEAGCAHLHKIEKRILYPGETYPVLPLETIHHTGNPSKQGAAIQISLYGGSETKRDFINGYDLMSNRVYPIYPPKTKKMILAREALAHF